MLLVLTLVLVAAAVDVFVVAFAAIQLFSVGRHVVRIS